MHQCNIIESEVSGVLVLGTLSKQSQVMKELLDRQLVKKTYHALVLGRPAWADNLANHGS